MQPAHSLKVGDCLHTVNGKRSIESVASRAVEPGDKTVTVVLDGATDLIVVGGVVTHAKPEHPEAHGKKRAADLARQNMQAKIKAFAKDMKGLRGAK